MRRTGTCLSLPFGGNAMRISKVLLATSAIVSIACSARVPGFGAQTQSARLNAADYAGRVTAIYLVPSDQTENSTRIDFFRRALARVKSFYTEKAGPTFEWDGQVNVVASKNDTAYFHDCDSSD